MGIRRWKLQKVLFDAVQAKGIPIHFDKKVCGITTNKSNNLVTLEFSDGTTRTAELVLASDGAKSPIRNLVAGHLSKLTYTGTTCLYGCASVPRKCRGICFPSSETTKCHACFYPVSPEDQCFQFHMPTPPNSSDEGGWGTLLGTVGEEECRKLAVRLQKDGWDEEYLKPLQHAKKAIKVPFALLEPHLESFVYRKRIVLVGDSAHPPVPYLGQGAQQGIEDAGTLALLLRKLCMHDGATEFSLEHIDLALHIYNRIRVPRTAEIISRSKDMGLMQQRRSENKRYNEVKEEMIRRDVFFHESMQPVFPGATYDYKEDVECVLRDEPLHTVFEEDEEIASC